MFLTGAFMHSHSDIGVFRQKSLRLMVTNLAPCVEMTLLIDVFDVVASPVFVLLSPRHSTRSPPTVQRTLLVSALAGRSAATIFRCVGVLLPGASCGHMKKHVLVPFISG